MERKVSIITGWFVFAVAFIVYFLTLEPTISFWDCSEFITCANKLEVGHAPGAPLFMLLGRIVSLFAGNDVTKIAFTINLLSAIASAFTIMFLFWTIEWFGKKLSDKLVKKSLHHSFYVQAGAFIGALSFAFTDTFWFSAVEGEVYATSSFLNAIVFWAILKWETQADTENGDKWILLIFFLMGLSIGVHLLNLLAIPAIVLVYYFKRYEVSNKGIFKALVFSFLLLVFLVFLFIPGSVQLAAYTDLLFVNHFNLPLYSGVIFFLTVLISGIIYLLWYSRKNKNKLLNTVMLSLTVLLLGYSSFTTLVIRSLSNPYIDINNVENVFGLVDYLNREQYGKRPLIYGNNYNSPVEETIERNTYKPYNGKYVTKRQNPKYIFDERTLTLFPRMASTVESHVSEYERWIDIKGKPIKVRDREGNQKTIKIPTFRDNITFFMKYQLGHMYFRYFMWNFAGKQNDIQSYGDVMHGNWISGIKFLDESRIGSQDNVPEKFENLPSKNKYFMIPLLLGLIGLVFHYRKDKRNFFVLMLLFFLTGIAIVLYLNEIPITPRERDYVFVGSYYAFSIWIGLSVIAIIDTFKSKKVYVNIFLILILFFLLPINLITENWDDHDRSGRYTARDLTFNFLSSCEKNAILFTGGDNDTYPLWYAQEVERYRRDIRTILTEFLPVDWYINQLSNKYENMGEVPISFTDKDFLEGKRMYLPVLERINTFVDYKELVDFVRSDNSKTKIAAYDTSKLDYIPTRKIKIPVNRTNFIKSCTSFNYNSDEIPEEINLTLSGNYLFRNDLLILDIIFNNNWERPVYFLNPTELKKIGLDKYMHREGFAYRLLPFRNDKPREIELSNSEYQYNKFMNEFNWGGVGEEDVMLDWMNVRTLSTMRIMERFSYAAQTFIREGDTKKAVELLDKCIELLPNEKVPYSYNFPKIIESYFLAGESEKAIKLFNEFNSLVLSELEYYKGFDDRFLPGLSNNIRTNLYLLQQLAGIKFPNEDTNAEVLGNLKSYYEYFYKVIN